MPYFVLAYLFWKTVDYCFTSDLGDTKNLVNTNACLSTFLTCQYNRCYSLIYCYFIELLVKKGFKFYGLRLTFSLK